MWGGGGSSNFFQSKLKLSEIQGGPTYVMGGGGGGCQTFFQGGGVQLLSDRTYDLYWTPVPAPDRRNYQEFQWTTVILSLAVFLSFIIYPPRCMF